MNTKQLRQKILDLAIKGKLVPQDPNDEPASKLLERIREEKERLIKEGKLKRDKNESYIFVGDDKLHYEKFSDGSVVCIEDEIPFEIPESWAWCRLKEVCTKIVDGAHNPPRGENVKTEYIMASSTNINNDRLVELEKVRYLSKKNYIKENERTDLRKGDILLTTVGTLGRSCVYNNDLNICFQRSVSVISTLIHNFYLKNFFDSDVFQQKINTEATGTAQKGFYLNQLSDVLIPIPPQSEQVRISNTVQKLLEILEAVENNKVDLSELITQTKSKVLDLAIKGKLVSQDPNDEPADKLLERIREEKEKLIKEGKLKRDKNETYIFKNSDDNSYYEKIDGETVCIDDDLPFEIPENWRWCKLKDVGSIIGGGTPKTNVESYWKNGDIPWLTPADMKDLKGKYVSKGNRNITKEGYNSSSAVMISKDSIVYSSRAPIGYIAITKNELCTNQGFKSIDLYLKESVNYLYYLLMAITADIKNRASGTTFQEISGSEFGQTIIPFPPLNEQIAISTKINHIFSNLDNLETIIKGS